MSIQQQLIADYVQSIEVVAPCVLDALSALFSKEMQFASRKHLFGDSFDTAVANGGIDRWARRSHLAGKDRRLSPVLLPVVRATWMLWEVNPRGARHYFDYKAPPRSFALPNVFFEMPEGLDAIVHFPQGLSPQQTEAWHRREWHPKQIAATWAPASDAEDEAWFYGFDRAGHHVDGIQDALKKLENEAAVARVTLEATIRHRKSLQRDRQHALMAVYFQNGDCIPEEAAQKAGAMGYSKGRAAKSLGLIEARNVIRAILASLGIEPRVPLARDYKSKMSRRKNR